MPATRRRAALCAMAMSHTINANDVRRWRRLARSGMTSGLARTVGFIPILLDAPGVAMLPADIGAELRRDATSLTVTCPAAAELTVWTREMPR